MIIDGIVAARYSGVPSLTVDSGQTQTGNDYIDNPKDYKRTATSYKYTTSAGGYTTGWTIGNSAQGIAYGAIAIREDASEQSPVWNAGRVTVGTEGNWETIDQATRSAYLAFLTLKEGVLSERVRINSDGDVLLNLNKHLNFGTTGGSTGFGIRDNNGVMEFKNNAGVWTPFVAEDTDTDNFKDLTDTPSSFVGQNYKIPIVNVAENTLEFINPFQIDCGSASTVYASNMFALDGGNAYSRH